MDQKTDTQNTNVTNRTIVIKPGAFGKNKTANHTVISNIAAPLFRKKEEMDDIIGTKTLAAYTSSELDTQAELPAPMMELDGEYEIVRDFAEGGQAVISIARDKNLGRIVAVKSLKKELSSQPGVVGSFVTEAKVTAQLDHPAIIPIYGLNNDSENGIHLAMKLVNGRTLREYLRNVTVNYRRKGVKAFDEEAFMRRRMEIFLHVCDAIAYAHHRNIMHRDLKPENIMLGEYMEVYVMDWGLARKIPAPDAPVGPPEPVSGTPRYFSPEALRGGRCDARSDIFTLGLILQEIVTLQFAVKGENEKKFMERIVNGELEPIEHLFGKRIDGALQAIIRKATAYRPSERYQTVSALSEDIRRYMSGLSISARPDDFLMKSARFAYRHRRGFLTVFLLLMLGAVSIAAHSIYDRLRHATETALRNELQSMVYDKTAASAADFDMTALHIQDQLCSIAQAASYLLHYNLGNGAMPDAFYPWSETDLREPPGLVYSPFYKRHTSFRHGVYKVAPAADKEGVDAFIRQVSPILPNMFRAVLESKPGVHLSKENFKLLQEEYLREGLPVKAVFVASKYGVNMLYPWRSSYSKEFDPRLRPWYKNALKRKGPVWGQPYVDADTVSGLSIPCSMQIRDINGGFYGVAGLDLSFNKLTNKLLRMGNTGPYVLEKAIINPAGRVFVSTHSDYFNKTFNPLDYLNPELTLPLFKSSGIRNRILKQGKVFGMFSIKDGKKEHLYSFARLKIFDLYYVEVIDFRHLYALEQNKRGE